MIGTFNATASQTIPQALPLMPGSYRSQRVRLSARGRGGPPEGGGHEGHVEPGTLHANVVASESATYRAVSAAGSSPELRVEVSDGAILSVAAKRTSAAAVVIRVSATPASPGANVMLQLRLRERFGWWPVARARLDKRSRAAFTVRRHAGAPARVLMVGPDWASPLSQSRVFRLARRTPR